VVKELSAIAFLLLSGCAASAPPDEAAPRVSVRFVEPEKFTDLRRAELAPTSAGVLRELERFLIEAGGSYLPEKMKQNIRVTDVDLAGDFELFAVRKADQVRMTKGLYPPRIMLEFEIIDGAGAVVRSGQSHLTDIDYQLRNVYPREDYLRYEKDILRDWLRAELGVLSADNSK
jgi:hypothetical protein